MIEPVKDLIPPLSGRSTGVCIVVDSNESNRSITVDVKDILRIWSDAEAYGGFSGRWLVFETRAIVNLFLTVLIKIQLQSLCFRRDSKRLVRF